MGLKQSKRTKKYNKIQIEFQAIHGVYIFLQTKETKTMANTLPQKPYHWF